MKKILTILGILVMMAGCATTSPKVEPVKKTAKEQLRESRVSELNLFLKQEEQHLVNFLSMRMGQFVFLAKDKQVVNDASNLAVVPFNVIVSHRQVAKLFVLVTYGDNGRWRVINIIIDAPQAIQGESNHEHKF